MKVTWIEEEGKEGYGEVTGINRGPFEGEKVLEETTDKFIWGYEAKYYTVVSNTISPMAEEDKEEYDGVEEKDEALSTVLSGIDTKNSEMNKEDFQYGKEGETVYNYVADVESLSTIEGNCNAKLHGSGSLTDPVPAPNGVWKTNEIEDGLTPIYVPMSISEFLEMTNVLTERGISNFGVKEFHKNNVKVIYADATSTAGDILGYDYSQGWN